MFSHLNLLKQNKSQRHRKKSPPADTLNKTDSTTGPGGKLNTAQRSLKCVFLRQKLKIKGRVCPTRFLGRRVEAKTSHKSLESAFRTSWSLREHQINLWFDMLATWTVEKDSLATVQSQSWISSLPRSGRQTCGCSPALTLPQH